MKIGPNQEAVKNADEVVLVNPTTGLPYSATNPLPTGGVSAAGAAIPDSAVSSASVTSATTGATFSTEGYGAVTFQILANASGNTVLVEGSNDSGTTWGAITLRRDSSQTGSVSGGSGTTSSSAGTIFIPAFVAPLMRWRVSNYISGTTTVAVGLKRQAPMAVQDVYVGGGLINMPGALPNGTAGLETSTTLGSGATFTGTARDATTAPVWCMFGASFLADQAGTAYVDVSHDNSTWVVAGSVAVTAGSLTAGPTFDINVRIRARYYRVRYVNGGVAQGVFRVYSSFTGA